MLKSCAYCGRIHDSRDPCEEKKKAGSRYPKDTMATKTRSSSRWQKTREYIRQRDHGVCQLCLRNYAGTLRPYETGELSVHHIVPLEETVAWDNNTEKAFDHENLITLCRIHHEMAEQGLISREALENIARENERRTVKYPPGI